jgi:hypothetical protein
MIREKFEEIANQLNCKYEYSEKRLVSLISRNIPTSWHHITLEYNKVIINLVYEFGGDNLAEIKSSIKTVNNIPNFNVTTKNQIQRLFSKDKRPFRIETSDPLFESKIMNFLDSSKYNEIAQKTTFEPEISGVKKEGEYIICTSFYVGFKDKELSVLPSINLHKMFIDKILK